jgi:hypothetical protein
MWLAGYGMEWFSCIKVEPSAGGKTFVKKVMNLLVALKAISFFCNYASSSFTRICFSFGLVGL